MDNLLRKYVPTIFGVLLFLIFACIGSINLMVIPLTGQFPANNMISFIFSLITGLILGVSGYLHAKKTLRNE